MKNRKCIYRKTKIVLIFTSLSLIPMSSGGAQVNAWEGTITIPTYGWSEDVNPKFWALEGQVKYSTTVKGTIIYPYPMQDHLYRTKENRTYKALFLENEFLKITCLPELGGRLHSVFDKTEGKEVFHLNNVIKPSMIAMRGAFISGGVEWNAGPQVHTVTILSPVNVFLGRNEDGSAFLEISNLEKSLRTRWTVRVTLHPGKAYLDESIRIFNPIDGMNPYYFWNCTAFPNRPGTRFIYPMSLGTDHYGVSFFNWPIHKGKDLTWLKNYDTWASIFAVNCRYDFFGAYDVDENRGVVQVANHNELSGKKAWTWGTWDFGLVSQKNLTDDDGPYIEVQSGPLPKQSDYGKLMPRESVSWQEWWYPVHGLGDGFEYATKDLAFQTIRSSDTLYLKIFATGIYPQAVCSISNEQKEVVKKTMNLSPWNPETLALTPIPISPLKVMVKRRNGILLASYTTPLPIPKEDEPELSELFNKPDERLTVEEKYIKALKYDLAIDRVKARHSYETILAQDSGYTAALLGLAVLDVESGLYNQAAAHLKKVLQRDFHNGLAWYYLGVCHLRRKNQDQVLDCAYKAARCFGTTSLGYDLAGRAYMRSGRHEKAVDAFRKAASRNSNDTKVKNHLLMALYAVCDPGIQKPVAERIATNPTDLIPRAILALQNDDAMDRFVKEVSTFLGELDFEMLEAGLSFAELGLIEEAKILLTAVCVKSVPSDKRNPLSLYYLAYFTHLLNDPILSMQYLKDAAETYRDYIYPSRPETVEILEFAVNKNPEDAYAHLHLGNLYANLGRLEEAVKQWQLASQLNPSLSIAFRNLGLYTWAVEKNLSKAEGFYQMAIHARPNDQTLYRDLAEILIADNRRSQAISVLESMPFEKMKRADTIMMLAQAYFDDERYDETIRLLESTPYFVNWEGQTITWDLFNWAHIERGKQFYRDQAFASALQDFEAALTYPENIGVGRLDKPREAPAQYWRGKTLKALGRNREALLAWKVGANGYPGSEEQNKYLDLCKEIYAKEK